MKRALWIGLVLVVAAAAFAVLAGRERPETWTTESPEARAEFEKGLDAWMKVYRDEARLHFARAASLDPSFAVAKAELLAELAYERDAKGVKELLQDLHAVDLTRLTPRERFLVERQVAAVENRPQDVEAITTRFLAAHPDDPFGLFFAAGLAQAHGDTEKAKELYRHLIDVAPNWVVAYNNLGYLEMRQGNYAEAEKMFTTYRFIAPDHANPHDSLGELLALTGRYDEAEREFEDAIGVKLDFCSSYEHLVILAVLQGRPEQVDAMLYRASESKACEGRVLDELRCSAAVNQAARAGDWEQAWDAGKGCESSIWLRFRAALMTGRDADADAIEKDIEAGLKKAMDTPAATMYRASFQHLEGTRAALAGRYAEAARDYSDADAGLIVQGLRDGVNKLFNLACLEAVLRAENDNAGAAKVEAVIDGVNPKVLQAFGRATELPVRH